MSKGFCSLVYGMVLFVITSTVIGPCSAQEETVDSGLIAHWKFEEGAGDVIKDSSGEGNDGTIVPANTPEPKWGTGDFANSVSFSGGNDHFIRIPPSASLNNLKKQISIVALIYPRTLWTPGSCSIADGRKQSKWPKNCSAWLRTPHQQGTSRLCNVNGEKQCIPINTISVTGRKTTFFITSGTSAC